MNTMKIDMIMLENEMVNKAINFFKEAGVSFPDSKHVRVYGLSIYIDETCTTPCMLNTFSLALNRKGLLRMYNMLTGNESRLNMGQGIRRVQALIRVLNELIGEGYVKGCTVSHNIETGKYNLQATEVVGIFGKIMAEALSHSTGGKDITRFGDIYKLLGGEDGTHQFFKEVLLATEAAIPDHPEDDRVMCGIAPIRCYTCKYCMTDYDGDRMCKKCCYELSTAEYERTPERFFDVHQHTTADVLVSAVISDRIKECEHYKMR